MKTAALLFCFLLLIPNTAMQKTQISLPKSKAELTNYEETSRYEDVIKFIAELQKVTDLLRVETFGKGAGQPIALAHLAADQRVDYFLTRIVRIAHHG